ncbi:MAG TPA: hypothetical protein VF100_01035, partial [Thermoanaerobaculia bacterium]
MSLKSLVAVLGGVAALASIVGVNLLNFDEIFGVPKLSPAQRHAIAAELRRVAADGHVSADERAGLGE